MADPRRSSLASLRPISARRRVETGSRSGLVLLGLIILLAVGLRLYRLDSADVITDEALIAFRSLGYVDFFASPYQTTPWEWFSDVPAWARLSFHDHPPLVFLVQHLSFLLLGEHELAMRLPFVFFGVGAVALLYLIGARLFDRQAGLMGSALLAVAVSHVWVSRIGLQEAPVIFFSLLTFYFFIRALETGRHWRWGIALGLGLLTKYTAIVFLPVILVYLLVFRREVFRDRRFWLTLLLVVILISPIVIYNLKLYQARGHFDLQLSYLLRQPVAEWQSLPGKIQAGSFTDRLLNLLPNLYQGLLAPMSLLLAVSLLVYGYRLATRTLGPHREALSLLLLAIAAHLLLFLVISPSPRFVVTVVPDVLLLVAWLLRQLPRPACFGLFGVALLVELFFTVNTLLMPYPVGQVGITYSSLKTESYQWGYHQLNVYLERLLSGKQPAVSFPSRYQFLEDIKQPALERAQAAGDEPVSWLLVYDANLYDVATLWIFHRQLVYHGWPVVTADSYLDQGLAYWRQQGITDFYFFKAVDETMLLQPAAAQTDAVDRLAGSLSDVTPEIIKRPDGREVFAVYHWR